MQFRHSVSLRPLIFHYDNTVFIFTSDNGSEASGVDNPRSLAMRYSLSMQGYDNNYDTLGLKGSFNNIGLNHQIFVNKGTSIGIVGQNASDFCGG